MSAYQNMVKRIHDHFETSQKDWAWTSEIDLCGRCGEHTVFSKTDHGLMSECCEAVPVPTDVEVDHG